MYSFPELRVIAANLAFGIGTGDRWLCYSVDGMGFDIEQGQFSAWFWSAAADWMTAVGRGGQAGSRLDAVCDALAVLDAAGFDLFELPGASDLDIEVFKRHLPSLAERQTD